jgi:hypothetical protein
MILKANFLEDALDRFRLQGPAICGMYLPHKAEIQILIK